MDFGGGAAPHAETILPYISGNAGDALAETDACCPGARRVQRYGYIHPVSASAVTPIERVMACAYCIER